MNGTPDQGGDGLDIAPMPLAWNSGKAAYLLALIENRGSALVGTQPTDVARELEFAMIHAPEQLRAGFRLAARELRLAATQGADAAHVGRCWRRAAVHLSACILIVCGDRV